MKIQDLVVRRALCLFEEQLQRDWSVDELARHLGVSRADLGRRFANAVGRPPFDVLREMRMKQAARLLRETSDGLAKIAVEVGYSSEFAFSRAFYRVMRVRPGSYRKLNSGSVLTRCAA